MVATGLRAGSGDLSSCEVHLRNHGLFREANSAEERLPLASLLLIANRSTLSRDFSVF
jgi:hypothetical protein